MRTTDNARFWLSPISILCWALIAFQLTWLGVVLRRWFAGEAPAYPRQYESRALNTIVSVGILGCVLLAQRPSFRRRFLYWLMLGGAVASLIVLVVSGW